MNEENAFGVFLRRYREERQLSTNDLHKITGVSQPYLSQLENGKKPSRKMIQKIASGLTKNNQSNFGKLYKELLSYAGYNTDWKFIDETPLYADGLTKNELEEALQTQKIIEEYFNKIEIELEELFNIAPQITIDGKTLSPQEKEKALQILKLTFDSSNN